MQTALDALTKEQLQSVFCRVPGVSELDAKIFARNAFGLLARGLSEEQAEAAKSGFAAHGIEVESVDESTLPPLPPIRHVRRLDCTAAALVIYDPLGKPVSLAWQDILLIATGSVMMA